MQRAKSLQNSWEKLNRSNRLVTAELQKLWKNATFLPFSPSSGNWPTCSWFMFSNQTLKPQEEGVTFACWPDRCWSSQAGAWSTQVQDNYPISYPYIDCQWFSMIGSLSPFTDVFTWAPPLPDVSSTSPLSNTPGCTSCWTLGRDLLHTFKDYLSLVHIIVTVMIIIMSSMSPNHHIDLF